MEEIYDVIIIGGGPGGLTAGIYSMRAALKTILVEKVTAGGQMNLSETVENWPGEIEIGGIELSQKMLVHAQDCGLEIINKEASAIEPGTDYHRVVLEDGEILRGHAVIMAMGGNPRQLNVPGEGENYGRGVSYCAVCDGFFFRGKRVTVVGGGDSAVEEALYLSKIAKEVYLVHRRDALRAGGVLKERILNESKVQILWNSVVTKIISDETGVVKVELKDTVTGETRELPTDGVFIFIGFVPNNSLVPAGIRLNSEGYVVTDENCATSIKGIYAIGDLREKPARQIITAAADGCYAALAAARLVEEKHACRDCI